VPFHFCDEKRQQNKGTLEVEVYMCMMRLKVLEYRNERTNDGGLYIQAQNQETTRLYYYDSDDYGGC
jgi:hypothetical protein